MLRALEVLAWALAATLLIGGSGVGLASCVGQRERLAAFAAAEGNPILASSRSAPLSPVKPPDRSDWSPARAQRYVKLLGERTVLPEAVLRIPALGLEAEILDATDDRSLDLGVGHIEGTAGVGEAGNIGIAGHRDGYFRRLKDIQRNQKIHIVTKRGRWTYAVERTEIVDPADVHVLSPTKQPALTLVTCYPFYFIGSAPKRFIVHAKLVSSEPATGTAAASGREDS